MIKRQLYLDQIKPLIDVDIIKVLTGIRRSGKTVLLSQIQELLIERGIDKNNIISINLESALNRRLQNSDTLYEYVSLKAKEASGKIYIFIDEIQDTEHWEKVINSFRVDFECDIYITGSNSKLLSGELATYLAGRYIQIHVYPFTLAETKEYLLSEKLFVSDSRLFADYLKYGGFPQVWQMRDEHTKNIYLKDLYDAIVLRDIVSRYNLRDHVTLQRLLAFLMDNIGNPFSARSISRTLESEGIKIAANTIINLIEYMTEAFALFKVSRYDIKGKNLLTINEKYYAADLGLRNTVKNSEVIDSSKLYENIVFLEMLSRGYEVRVGKLDDKEIDFICYKDRQKLYIQVAYLITDNDTEREFGNLEKINDNYPKYVISGDMIDLSRNGIIHRNIIDFLLEH